VYPYVHDDPVDCRDASSVFPHSYVLARALHYDWSMNTTTSTRRTVRNVKTKSLGTVTVEQAAPGCWVLLPSGKDLPRAMFMHLHPVRLGTTGNRYSRERWSVPMPSWYRGRGADTARTLDLAVRAYARHLHVARSVSLGFAAAAR
jgi:hypothetical protein